MLPLLPWADSCLDSVTEYGLTQACAGNLLVICFRSVTGKEDEYLCN
jgi:hypothetical protein